MTQYSTDIEKPCEYFLVPLAFLSYQSISPFATGAYGSTLPSPPAPAKAKGAPSPESNHLRNQKEINYIDMCLDNIKITTKCKNYVA